MFEVSQKEDRERIQVKGSDLGRRLIQDNLSKGNGIDPVLLSSLHALLGIGLEEVGCGCDPLYQRILFYNSLGQQN